MLPLATGPSLTPPFDDPILIFAIAMCAFLLAPLVFERYRLPGIIGVIVVGAAIGPNGIGLLDRTETFVLLGEVGLVYLMFVAGLEIDLDEFVENREMSVVFGALSFLLPQAIGTVFGITILGFDLPTAALYAAIFSSHTLLAYPIVNRLGIAKNDAVTAAIGGTILTDTAALLVLAIAIGAAAGDLTLGFWAELGIGLSVFFAGVWILVPRLGRFFFRNVPDESYYEFLFVIAVLFVCAFVAELAGVKHIIGAFLAGLALNRLIPQTGTLMNRIEFVGNALLIPFFLISVGMLVDVAVIVEGPETLVIAGSIVVLMLSTKLVASFATGAIYDYTVPERLTMFSLSAGQAAAALAITLIGFDLGLFDEPMVNGVVVMILVVSVISPALSERYGRRIVEAEEQAEYDPGEAPPRVLVPLSGNSETLERLLDFGMLVRESGGNEPLRAMTVVRGDLTDPIRGSRGRGDDATGAEVAEAEEVLTHAEEYVSGAEVPIETQTHVDENVVTGILRAVEENRIRTVITGWPGTRRFGSRLFGGTIDQLVERSTQLVLVSKLEEKLNVADRVVCLLPGRIASHPGFYEAVGVVKTVADQLGVELVCLVAGANAERYEELIDAVEPDTTLSVETVPIGPTMDDAVAEHVGETDLFVAISPRPNARGWRSDLSDLPDRLVSSPAANVVVTYPAEEDSSDRRRFLRVG
ncbi:cation:proton antiporter [Natronorarus salvus]|uniref:cation:proton antiporter n=1 Tax=Natronorarus salvus TaxID=3117733 RepID=UPI002F26352C